MSLPHAWPVDQVVTEATRGRDAVLEDVHRRPCHTWHSARSRGHAQSSPRDESSPSRAPSARGHSKMAEAAEVLQRDLGTGKSFCNSVFNGARPPMCSVHHSAETDSATTRSDGNRAKPMLLKNRQKFSSLESSSLATSRSRRVDRTRVVDSSSYVECRVMHHTGAGRCVGSSVGGRGATFAPTATSLSLFRIRLSAGTGHRAPATLSLTERERSGLLESEILFFPGGPFPSPPPPPRPDPGVCDGRLQAARHRRDTDSVNRHRTRPTSRGASRHTHTSLGVWNWAIARASMRTEPHSSGHPIAEYRVHATPILQRFDSDSRRSGH